MEAKVHFWASVGAALGPGGARRPCYHSRLTRCRVRLRNPAPGNSPLCTTHEDGASRVFRRAPPACACAGRCAGALLLQWELLQLDILLCVFPASVWRENESRNTLQTAGRARCSGNERPAAQPGKATAARRARWEHPGASGSQRTPEAQWGAGKWRRSGRGGGRGRHAILRLCDARSRLAGGTRWLVTSARQGTEAQLGAARGRAARAPGFAGVSFDMCCFGTAARRARFAPLLAARLAPVFGGGGPDKVSGFPGGVAARRVSRSGLPCVHMLQNFWPIVPRVRAAPEEDVWVDAITHDSLAIKRNKAQKRDSV